MKARIGFRIPLFLASMFLLVSVHATDSLIATADYCYKGSATRGAGTVPTDCGVKEKEAGLCYPKCKTGYSGAVTGCYQDCPSGYVDTGALCHIDKPLTASFNYTCTTKDIFGTCWAWSAACPSGYVDSGLFCALKTPAVPAGYSGLTGLDLVKQSYDRGVGAVPTCPSGKQNNAGLCYSACSGSAVGNGPVCWNKCPAATPVECGAGCAKDAKTCGMVTASQTTSVLQTAFFVATLGASGGATEAAEGAKAAESVAQASEEAAATAAKEATAFEKAVAEAKAAWNAWKDANPKIWSALTEGAAAAKQASFLRNYTKMLVAEANVGTNPTAANARAFADAAAQLDPTGISETVSAYTHAVCK